MRRLLRSVACAAALCVAAAASATTFEDETVRCPACERDFQTVHVTSTNTYGGVDADGCVLANGDSPLAHLVDVCPHCLCARLPNDRERAPSGDAAKRWRAAAAQQRPFPEGASPRTIPARVRYDLASGLLAAEGAAPGLRAAVHLRAAWTEREETRAAFVHPADAWDADVPREWRKVVGEVWDRSVLLDPTVAGGRTRAGREMTAALAVAADGKDAPDALLRRLCAAVILRVHGELVLAGPELEALAPSGSVWSGGSPAAEAAKESAPWIATAARELLDSVSRERDELRACVQLVGGDPAAGEAARAWRDAWLVSECERRLGDDEAAAKSLVRALADPSFELGALVLLADAAAVAGDRSPKWKATVERAWNDRLGALLGRLGDPDESEGAARTLARLADRTVLPELAKLVTGGDAAKASAAALALSGYDDPGAERIAAVEKLVSDPAADIDLRSRGIEALVAWASPSSAPVFRAVLASKDDYLHESAVGGLGRTGAPSDVNAVLRLADDAPEAVARALSLLAARPFDHPDDFVSWREEAGDPARWIANGLREAGASDESLGAAEAAPALLPLLTDARLPVRWNAFRALREIGGRPLGMRDVLYEGRFRSPRAPESDAPLDLDDVLGDGWTVTTHGMPGVDLDALGPALQPLRDKDGRRRWEIAEALWREWWAHR